jgi:uncharacterized protein (DUF1684 family)
MTKLKYVFIAVAVLAFIYFTIPQENTEEHIKFIYAERAKKKGYLKQNSESPFVKSGKEMGELSYFPIDSKYKVTTKVERIEKRQLVMVANSDGSAARYLKYAWLHFKIDDEELKLVVLKQQFGIGYFLGFTDVTSGEDSYGGGRYLDISEIKGDRVTLDFNLAYNPYCAYSAEFQCPLPPKENDLGVAIESGEKDYGK